MQCCSKDKTIPKPTQADCCKPGNLGPDGQPLHHGRQGAVICCGGKEVVCFFPNNAVSGDATALAIRKEFTEKHEKEPFGGHTCPYQCDDISSPTFFQLEVYLAWDECRAYRKEIACLKNGKTRCRTDGCRIEIDNEIRSEEEFKSEYCQWSAPWHGIF